MIINARIEKEIRAISMVWLAGLLLLVLPFLIGGVAGIFKVSTMGVWINALGVSTFLLIPATIMVAVSPFGSEMVENRMGFLLAQPADRRVIWREKLGVLALAIGLLFLFHALATFVIKYPHWVNDHMTYNGLERSIFHHFQISWAVPMFALGLTPLLALVTRRDAAAFWLTLLLCGFFTVWSEDIAIRLGITETTPIRNAILFFLGGLGLISTYHYFIRWQDRDWIGIEFNLPELFRKSAPVSEAQTRKSNGWTAVFLKELRLQQLNFIFLVGFVLLLVVFLFTCRFEPRWEEKGYVDAAVMCLRLLLAVSPVFFGAAAIAEERRLGIHTWHTTFPISIHRQWCIKFLVAALLSVLVGSVLHYGLEKYGWILESVLPGVTHTLGTEGILSITNMLLIYCVIPWAGLVIGFYASSLSQHLLQALSSSILITLLFVFAFGVLPRMAWTSIDGIPQNHIVVALALPLMTFCLLSLSRRNWITQERLSIILLNNGKPIGLLSVVILIAGVFLYFRTWERVTIPNPADARYQTAQGQSPVIEGWNQALIISTDGSLWLQEMVYSFPNSTPTFYGMPYPRQIGRDTNWKQALPRGFDVGLLALKKDGSLWALGNKPELLGIDRKGPLPELTQVGTDRDWAKIVGNHGDLNLGLKSDGSLWIWGRNTHQQLGYEDEMLTLVEPTKVGIENDWVDVALYGRRIFALKKDSSVWHWGGTLSLGASKNKLVPTHEPQKAASLPPTRMFIKGTFNFQAVTRDNQVWAFHHVSQDDLLEIEKLLGSGPIDPRQTIAIEIDADNQLVTGGPLNIYDLSDSKINDKVWAEFFGYNDDPRAAMTPDGTFWLLPTRFPWLGDSESPLFLIPPQWRPEPVGRLVDGAVFP